MPRDYDGSGRPSLIIGNFSNEMMALYSNEGTGLFIDEAPTSTIGKASLLTLTFACFFFDFDLDGLLDIFAANGHVADDISTRAAEGHLRAAAAPVPEPRRQEVRGGHAPRRAGASTGRWSRAARPTATIDNDGDLDLVVTATTARRGCCATTAAAAITRCASTHVGTTSNRDGIGAQVQRHADDGQRAGRWSRPDRAICSQSELPLTFGLGAARPGHVDRSHLAERAGRDSSPASPRGSSRSPSRKAGALGEDRGRSVRWH